MTTYHKRPNPVHTQYSNTNIPVQIAAIVIGEPDSFFSSGSSSSPCSSSATLDPDFFFLLNRIRLSSLFPDSKTCAIFQRIPGGLISWCAFIPCGCDLDSVPLSEGRSWFFTLGVSCDEYSSFSSGFAFLLCPSAVSCSFDSVLGLSSVGENVSSRVGKMVSSMGAFRLFLVCKGMPVVENKDNTAMLC